MAGSSSAVRYYDSPEEVVAAGGGSATAPSSSQVQYFDSPDEVVAAKAAPSKTEAFLGGAAQSATFNLADEGVGAFGAAKALVSGERKDGEDFVDFLSQKYGESRDKARARFKELAQAEPEAYAGGELAGAVGSAFIPGLGAVGAGKGLIGAVKGGATLGALSGFGGSEAKDLSGLAQDTAAGSGYGALGGAAGYGLQKSVEGVGTLAKKGVAALGQIEDKTADRVLEKGYDQVMRAPTRRALGEDVHAALGEVRDKIVAKSKAATELIPESLQIETSPLVTDIRVMAENLGREVGDSAQKASATLTRLADRIDNLGGTVTGRDFKQTILKSLGKEIDIRPGSVDFNPGVQDAMLEVYGAANRLLKPQVPEYAKAMEEVSSLADLRKRAMDLLSTPDKATSTIKRIASKEGDATRASLLEELGSATGKDLLGSAKNAVAKSDILADKTRGSKNTNLMITTAAGLLGYATGSDWKDTAKGAAVGALLGQGKDKFGGVIAARLLSAYRTGALNPAFQAIGATLDKATTPAAMSRLTEQMLRDNQDFKDLVSAAQAYVRQNTGLKTTTQQRPQGLLGTIRK
jgi:hypothetical protein